MLAIASLAPTVEFIEPGADRRWNDEDDKVHGEQDKPDQTAKGNCDEHGDLKGMAGTPGL